MTSPNIDEIIKSWKHQNLQEETDLKVTSTYNYFDIFFAKSNLEGVDMPETILFKEGGIFKWFFTSTKGKTKKILKKKPNKLHTEGLKEHFKKMITGDAPQTLTA
jgi:hypothetical protein